MTINCDNIRYIGQPGDTERANHWLLSQMLELRAEVTIAEAPALMRHTGLKPGLPLRADEWDAAEFIYAIGRDPLADH